jgi:hypothetical protein
MPFKVTGTRTPSPCASTHPPQAPSSCIICKTLTTRYPHFANHYLHTPSRTLSFLTPPCTPLLARSLLYFTQYYGNITTLTTPTKPTLATIRTSPGLPHAQSRYSIRWSSLSNPNTAQSPPTIGMSAQVAYTSMNNHKNPFYSSNPTVLDDPSALLIIFTLLILFTILLTFEIMVMVTSSPLAHIYKYRRTHMTKRGAKSEF